MSNAIDTRYASKEMSELFSDISKYNLWRDLWLELAMAEQSAGVGITDEQVDELESHAEVTPESIVRANELEKTTHHDVMAHIKAYGEECPKAAGIIHLGATSCYVTDNADVIRMREGMGILYRKVMLLARCLYAISGVHSRVECVAFTHYQEAQPTTVGKRVAMWLQDFLMDSSIIGVERSQLRMLGCRGATGTCADLLELVNGDENKVRTIEERICGKYSILPFPISGQTYTRKQDFNVAQALAGVAMSASKMATDIRLLSHDGEVREPFDSGQVGSSAMPYKRNPMMCERICSLSRMVISDLQVVAETAANQWLERSLDDSACRRVTIPDMFMLTDGILELCIKVTEGLQVDKERIEYNLIGSTMVTNTEKLLMYCVKEKGMDRQEAHEVIRRVTTQTTRPSLVDAFVRDGGLGLTAAEIKSVLYNTERVSGMATSQTEDYLWEVHNLWLTETSD